MNVIFLDIDGVLNCEDTFKKIYILWKKTGFRGIPLSDEKVKILKEIVNETNALIVLSSTWRLGFNKDLKPTKRDTECLVDLLNKHGLSIYDKTDYLGTKRGVEIRKWLKEHKEVTNFVILDDDRDMEEYTNSHLVQTNFYKGGLLPEHINQVKEKLSVNNKMKKRD